MTFILYNENCLDVMKRLEDNSVDSIVTDPPYGLSFMGKKWDYDVPSVEIWAECLRVLKPGGHLLAFAGTRTQHRMAVRIEDAGFEIRDMIAWIYGSGFPKSHNLKDEWQGWGTALKPALEPITVARKPLIGTVAENVLEHGTGGLNIDACRVVTNDNLGHVNNPTATWGTYGSGPNKAAFGEVSGRWPANLIHDGSDEVVGMFPRAKSGGYPAEGLQRSHVSTYGKPNKTPPQRFTTSEGSAARFFYCAKASKRDRDEGLDGFTDKQAAGLPMRSADGERGGEGLDGTKTDRLTIRKNVHPTVKPTDLMRYLCRLVTPPGGVVLDPFMGSGSTGKAAMIEGFQFIGCEMSPEYFEIAKARIEAAQPTKPIESSQPQLF
jgi:site-specific DNA-methyltransferase (adenine-specific)